MTHKKFIAVTDERIQILAIISLILTKGWASVNFSYQASGTSLIVEIPNTDTYLEFLKEIESSLSISFNDY